MSEQVDLAQLVSRVQGEFRSLRERAGMTDAARKLVTWRPASPDCRGTSISCASGVTFSPVYLGVRAETIKEQWAGIRSHRDPGADRN
jgi:hypothetical protein